MRGDVVLEVKDLQTQFFTHEGVVPSVNGVSFKLKKGEITTIVGESGSGKSVTSYSIMRLLEKTGKIVGGEILLEGDDLVTKSEKEMRKIRGKRISMIFQEPLSSLNPIFKIGYQIDEITKLHEKLSKKAAKVKSIEMLKKVGIARPEKIYEAYPHQLSGGMRQRVMIAMALACNPEILIADEPTTALDVTIQAQILKILNEIKNELETSILLITHDLGVVAEVADHVLVMYAGKVMESSDVYTIFKDPKHPYTKGLLNSTPKLIDTPKRLGSISGNVPNYDELPKGCKFSTRCPFVTSECLVQEPELYKVNDRSLARCILYKDSEVD